MCEGHGYCHSHTWILLGAVHFIYIGLGSGSGRRIPVGLGSGSFSFQGGLNQKSGPELHSCFLQLWRPPEAFDLLELNVSFWAGSGFSWIPSVLWLNVPAAGFSWWNIVLCVWPPPPPCLSPVSHVAWTQNNCKTPKHMTAAHVMWTAERSHHSENVWTLLQGTVERRYAFLLWICFTENKRKVHHQGI